MMYTNAEKKRTKPDGGRSRYPREARGAAGDEPGGGGEGGEEPDSEGGGGPEEDDPDSDGPEGEEGEEPEADAAESRNEESDDAGPGAPPREPELAPEASSDGPPRFPPSPAPRSSPRFPPSPEPRPKGNHLPARAGARRDGDAARERESDAPRRPDRPAGDAPGIARATPPAEPAREGEQGGGRVCVRPKVGGGKSAPVAERDARAGKRTETNRRREMPRRRIRPPLPPQRACAPRDRAGRARRAASPNGARGGEPPAPSATRAGPEAARPVATRSIEA